MGLSKTGLVIGHLNIQGLRSKFDELQILLSSNNIDIFGITESKLSEIHPSECFAVDGFQIPFRNDRSKDKGGGILIYVRNSITCHRRNDLEDSCLEHVWLEIDQSNAKSFLLCILYRHPNEPVSWNDSFEANIEKVQLEDKEILVLGDFNKDLTHNAGEWLNYTSSLGLSQLITSPTRVCNNSSTLIDHIYSDNAQNVIWTTVPQLGLSDHYPIFCSRKINYFKKSRHFCIKYRSLKNFNEDEFLTDLSAVNWNTLIESQDVNEVVSSFIDKFCSIIDKHVPMRQHRVKRAKQPDWLNAEILDAMKDRDKFKARNDEVNYRLYRNKVSTLINCAKKQCYENKINEGQNDPSTIWKLFKEFRSPSNDKSSVNSLSIDGQELSEPEIMSNEFNTFFTNIAAKLKEPIPPSNFEHISKFVNDHVPEPMYFNIPYICEEKVRKMLSNLDISKSTGLDEIGPRFLKLSSNIIYPAICRILNASISQCVFPEKWKLAKVCPLFKAGCKQDVNNYRPISILPTLSKLLEKHVHNNFIAYLNHYNLIIQTQSGFRKNHSCETALVHIFDKWLKAVNDGFIVGVVMVDFKKAFDLVDHNVLLQKLALYKCSKRTLDWFKSYLLDRKQIVALNGAMSSDLVVKYGVPQGSILGPLLFLLFINDLPMSLSVETNTTDMYADDTTIHCIDHTLQNVQRNLQLYLHNLETWCKSNGMILNTDKTKVLLITTPHKRARLTESSLSLTFKKIPLKTSKGEKLLGLQIDENLKWDCHINKLRRKMSTNLWLLNRIKTFIPVNARILFYKAYIQPHLDFCNVVWGCTSQKNIHKIFILQKRACKIIFGQDYVSVSDSLEKMSSLSIFDKVILHKAKFMYKVSKGLVPSYISNMFEKEEKAYNCLRTTNLNNFKKPRPKLELFKQSISFSGPSVWNMIPKSIQCMDTIESFTSNFIRWIKS